MPADADAPLGMQAGFALPTAARVLKERDAAGLVSVAEDDIGNELLEAGVLLHGAARAIADEPRLQQGGEIAIDVARDPLEMSQPMELRGRNDKDVLGGDKGHAGLRVCLR